MANRIVQIPKGKIIELKSGGAPLPGLENTVIRLEEDIALTISSNFNSIVGGGSSKALTLLGGLLRDTAGFGFSGQFKQLGFQMWTGTNPISFSPTVSFHMLNNAYEDVVKPTHALMKLPLPIDASSSDTDAGFG